ncbi:MAG: hypothetical protein ACKO1V_04420 [Cyanobium sp.]
MRLLSRCSTLLTLLALPLLPASAAIAPHDLPVAVCVISPRVEPVEAVDGFGVVPTPTPRLVVLEPLLELRILREGQPPWQRSGTPSRPILTPLDWPTTPIGPGEFVQLQLRPRGAAAGAFAHVQLAGGSEQRMRATEALLARLGQDPAAWLEAFDRALDYGDVPLAWTLLFHPRAPRSGELDGLRAEVIRRGCGS